MTIEHLVYFRTYINVSTSIHPGSYPHEPLFYFIPTLKKVNALFKPFFPTPFYVYETLKKQITL
jgi:hypothetical protein